ncbi:MFS transporter, partial [Bacillus mycoides]|nr:MFS transporter [Bacillus mycoides]
LAGFGPVIFGLLGAGGNLMGGLSLIFIIYTIGLVTMLLCVPETIDKVLE